MNNNEPTNTWVCGDCGATCERYRGQGDVQCSNADCDAEFNSFGQMLRRDWRSNRSNFDEDVSDLDGFEEASLRAEWEAWDA